MAEPSQEDLSWGTSPECYEWLLTEPPEGLTMTKQALFRWTESERACFRKKFEERMERERAELETQSERERARRAELEREQARR